jgi:Fur family transcriptional regulator, ferric uptake regulator
VTAAPDTPVRTFDDLDGALAVLREHGLRISSARRLVLQSLFAASEPISAEALANRLTSAGLPLDLASVYRNLETLERTGIVRHVHLGHGPGLYVRSGREDGEFLYCEGCGRVTVLEPHELDAIRTEIRDRFGLTARFAHFPIVGLCAGCAAPGPTRHHDH